MYELIQAGEKSWYIKSPANVGVYRMNDKEVCLIDSGNDKDAGRKILKIITERGWRVNCIVNTHFQRRPHRRQPVHTGAYRLPRALDRRRKRRLAPSDARADDALRRLSIREAAQ